ncbi:MAG: hypothetical protein U1F70_13220 [Candidatus Competibacteraceae bacterium]
MSKSSRWITKVSWLMAWLSTVAPGIQAAEDSQIRLGWNTAMGPAGTAYDAARRIFPGASKDKEENLTLTQDKVLRMPGTSKTRATLPKGTTLSSPESLNVGSEGKQFKLLLWEGTRPDGGENGGFGESVAVLAVFPEGGIEPTDVAEVKQDRETFLSERVNLGGEDAFTVLNTHHNSNQGYVITDLFHLREGRLRHIANLFTLSSNCCCGESFKEELRWRAEPDGANPPRIVATVELTQAPKEFTEGCDPKPKPRVESFKKVYRWDAVKQRYLHESGDSGRLDKWNQQRL